MQQLRISIALALLAACGSASAVLAQTAHFGQPGTVKVRIPANFDGVSKLQARQVADYGSFSVLELPAADAAQLSGAEILENENKILLNVGAIDTTRSAAPVARGSFAGRSLHLVQFAGPVQPEWFSRMTESGVEVVTYLPSNAYLVYGSAEQIAKLQEVAAQRAEFQWNGRYEDEYKIDPAAGAMMADPAIAVQRNGESSPLFSIQLVRDGAANPATVGTINAVRNGDVVSEYELLNYHNIIAPIPPAMLGAIAARPDVVSIQPYLMPEKMDERQDQIIAGNLSGNVPSGPGYLAWLGSKGFTQAQFNASNFAVDVSDSGIDNATTSPNHFGLYEGGIRPGASRIIYNRLIGTAHSGSTLKGCDGHGTLNTHIVLGYDDLAGFPFADSSGYHYGLGVCPFVKAGSSVIFDPSTFTSPNYANLQSQAYNSGARISTNSWGANVAGAYNTDAQSYDALVRDAQPTGSTFATAGNQEMVIVFSAGNAGSGSSTIGSPGTGKNVITVGAAENVQPFGGSDLCATTDSQANSANDIVSFSSRGPCSDTRRKPDIVAPGTHVSGGVVQVASPSATGTADSCYTANGVCGGFNSNYFPNSGQQFYTASSGTSHSCPAVAGACALIRQFFINNSLTPPSPAMTKAVLMNSARYMTGTGAAGNLWSNSQGMGMMNLGELFLRNANTVIRDQDAGDMFTASGQSRVFTGTIADSTKPFRVTLAWTDAPGATGGAAYKNNLDLTVTVGANTYKGNVFSGSASTTGGSADAVNNVESVFLPAGTSGSFTVTVTATNIVADGVPNVGGALDQDFALVIYNRADPCVAATVSVNPVDVHACPGSSRQFSALGAGSPTLNYQWRKGNTNLANGGHYSGVNTPTLTVSSISGADVATNYNCFVSNSCGGQASTNAAIIFCPADFNCDGTVDDSDFVLFSDAYSLLICSDPSMPAGCPADLNGDTFVDDSDFVLFSDAYSAFFCP